MFCRESGIFLVFLWLRVEYFKAKPHFPGFLHNLCLEDLPSFTERFSGVSFSSFKSSPWQNLRLQLSSTVGLVARQAFQWICREKKMGKGVFALLLLLQVAGTLLSFLPG